MNAVLLAAGRGTRLGPFTERQPKILAPLGGRTLLERQLSYLSRNGISEVSLNAHHLAGKVLEFVNSLQAPLPIRVSVEPQLLGTAGALLPFRDFLTETFVVVYGDVVADVDLGSLVAAHRHAAPIATLGTWRSAQTAGKGVVEHDSEGRVRTFVEKAAGETGPASVNAGIYVLEPEILEFAFDGADFGFDVWPAVLAAGRSVYTHDLDQPVYDVGTPEGLEAANAALAAGSIRW